MSKGSAADKQTRDDSNANALGDSMLDKILQLIRRAIKGCAHRFVESLKLQLGTMTQKSSTLTLLANVEVDRQPIRRTK